MLDIFGVKPSPPRISLFTNLCLTVMIVRRAIPESLPLFVPEAADATVAAQIRTIVDCLASLRDEDACNA